IKNNLVEPLTAANTTALVTAVRPIVDIVMITNQLPQKLLAPEVLAGQKMDLNRPFGDGVDNNNNGVVDEPLEAGEPYLDKIADGKYTSGDPFIDLNGNGKYDGPNQTPPQAGFDQLWQQLTASGAIQQAI